MARRIRGGKVAEVERAAGRLEVFRSRSRGGRPRRLPERLWARAVDLARRHGVNPIARALRLDYYGLKRRLAAAGKQPARESLPKFVEVGLGPFPGGAGHTIEVEDSAGAKMIVRVAGGSAADLVALAEALWRRAR